MNKTTLPEEITTVAARLFDRVYMPGFDVNAPGLINDLSTLINSYDDPSFVDYRHRFKSAFMHETDRELYDENYRVVEGSMGTLRSLEESFNKRSNFSADVSGDLRKHVGEVYTRLEVMHMHAILIGFSYR
ncbi:hypothetical protein H6504_04145 [Candidatus Woesearchaeota archaeon]|nr:hypothetical protein [Candidatus Woesearchaeota archaeon]